MFKYIGSKQILESQCFQKHSVGRAAQITRKSRTNVRVSATSSSTTKISEDANAQQTLKTIIAHKESELASITSPDRVPPKASVVANLRKEIAVLQRQLSVIGGKDLPLSLAADLTALVTPSPATISPASMPASIPTGARGALLLVEQQLAVASSSNGLFTSSSTTADSVRSALQAVEQGISVGSILGTGDLAELERLQQEHTRLKSQLESLLVKKGILNDLKKKNKSLDSPKKSPTPRKKRTTQKDTENGASSSSKTNLIAAA